MHHVSSPVQNLAIDFSRTSPLLSPLYGALDLGTNTCRMLIAEADPFSANPSGFHILDSFSRVIRFGVDLEETGILSTDAIDRALIALDECAKRLDLHRVKHVRCVTTAACRKAKNADAFVQKVLDQTGLTLEIISPQEEAFLAVSGCFDLMNPEIPYSIVFDIGGGSSELVLIEVMSAQQFRVLDWLSLPFGVLSLSDSVCSDAKKQEISQEISFEVNEFSIKNKLYELIDQHKVQMVGASGTVTTLAAILLNLERYDRKKVHQTLLFSKDLNRVISYLWSMKRTDRLNHPCIGPQRSDFIMGGVSIFQGIYDILPVNPVLVADRGVREGLLRTLMTQYPPILKEAEESTAAAA